MPPSDGAIGHWVTPATWQAGSRGTKSRSPITSFLRLRALPFDLPLPPTAAPASPPPCPLHRATEPGIRASRQSSSPWVQDAPGRGPEEETSMQRSVDRSGFREMFADRAVVFTRLPAGPAHDLAARANESVGRGDASLHTPEEFDALFALLADGAEELRLNDEQGRPTDAGTAVEQYRTVALDKDGLFAVPMLALQVSGWPADAPTMSGAVVAPHGARLSLWPTDPTDLRATPPPDATGVLFTTTAFELANTGNRTLNVPKRSWRATLDV